MPFQVSPGVNITEVDLTTIVPAVSTTVGAVAGVFSWGPVEDRVLISTENELVNTFGKPTSSNFETFYTAANFLAYGNQLYVSRAASATNYNAIGDQSSSSTQIKNKHDYDNNETSLKGNADFHFYAKYPGTLGNSLKISVCPSATAFSFTATANSSTADMIANIAVGSSSLKISAIASSALVANATAAALKTKVNTGDYLKIGNTTIGQQYVKVVSVGAITNPVANTYTFTVSLEESQKLKDDWNFIAAGGGTDEAFITRQWEYFNAVEGAPGTSNYVSMRNADMTVADEMHVVVVDEMGDITGVPGTLLEVWKNLSRASDAKGEQGGSIYWRDVLKNNSQWVWPGHDMFTSDTAVNLTGSGLETVVSESFGGGGTDDTESDITLSKVMAAYDIFAAPEDIDLSLVLTGKSRGGVNGEQLANYLIDNIAETRKDCVVFVSPQNTDVVNVPGQEASNIVAFRNDLHSSSYAVLDSGYKYQYDKYNDVYRWVPLNGDIAGLCVRTDNIRDPWFSPAGFNRGNIKNVVKLAYNPDKADRDLLYKNGANPVVNFPGQGVVLYGDKTLLARPSAFDRINVRRLFIVLEKAIAKAAQSSLFELNDDFTRAAFRNLVEPYLRDIQGRRGIYDFRVVCDTTNNTPEVIDRNEFRGDIYVKPAKSINFIQLNFVAVRTGVEFDEIVGKF